LNLNHFNVRNGFFGFNGATLFPYCLTIGVFPYDY
jgi:hypothetical protein